MKELAKEYRKLAGKSVPAEIVLVGGASILTNYGFRNMTTDMDAIIRYYRESQKKLAREQRRLSRKKGSKKNEEKSKNYLKQ